MPLGDLPSRVVADLAPVFSGSAWRGCAEQETTDERRPRRPVRVQQQQLHAGVPQTFLRGHVEHKELVKDRVWCTLLHMSLLLAHALLPLI